MLGTVLARAGLLLTLFSASPALAFGTPLDRGPLADFLSIFRQSAVPRQLVAWRSGYAPGTVVISTGQRRLYYVLGNGQAIQYGVGVGRQGFTWAGTKTVTMKREWPDWRPPVQMVGAVVGGAVGAVATAPGSCYYRNRYGRLRRVC